MNWKIYMIDLKIFYGDCCGFIKMIGVIFVLGMLMILYVYVVEWNINMV